MIATQRQATTRRQRAVLGRYRIAESVAFGFGHQVAARGQVMRLAFVLDDQSAQVGVVVTQPAPDLVDLEVTAPPGAEEAAADQAARVLSLDVDARGYDDLVDADPVLRVAVAARPGLRPVLFYSAYEALLWSVLSARRPATQMRTVRQRLAEAHGRRFVLAGEEVSALPTARELLDVEEFPGIPEQKLARMRAVAEVAAAGELDTSALRDLPVEEAERVLRRFAGIGPFYAQLVTVRALGHIDALPREEPRVRAATGALLGRDLDQEGFAEVADAWRPWRTWASVAVRAQAESGGAGRSGGSGGAAESGRAPP